MPSSSGPNSGFRRVGAGGFVAIAVTLFIHLSSAGYARSAETGFQHDADQSIEVESDSLEIVKDEETAVFRGNVTATQGSLGLRADILTVKYQPSEQSTDTGSPFSRIDATGNVVLTSQDETATGDWAVYEVDGKTITLGGTVVLTRGGNIIKGQRLIIDLVTGRSIMDGGDIAVGAGAGRQRVRAVFMPEKKDGSN